MHNRGAIAPHWLSMPAGYEGIECCLRLTISTIAAETATVRAAWKHDVEALSDMGAGAQLAEARDELLNAPQQQAHLCLGRGSCISQGALDTRCSKWEE